MEHLGMKNYPYKYPYSTSSSSYSQEAACLPYYNGCIDNTEGIQIQSSIKSIKFVKPGTCIDDDADEALIFDTPTSKRPYDYSLLGTASLGPEVRLYETAKDDSSLAVTQYWQTFAANVGDPAQTITCNSPASYLLNSSSPLFPPTQSHRGKKAAAGGEGHDHDASRKCIVNGHVRKVVERQRRSKMKALCSTLISLLPEEFNKTKHTLPVKLLEVIEYIRHLQDKVIEVGNKRDKLNFSATVEPVSNRSCVYRSLETSHPRPPNIRDKFQTIKVCKFGQGIQVTVNTFNNQIDFSSLLMVLEEAEVEVVSTTVSAINDRVFYSIHSKISDFHDFDSAVLHRRIDQLMNGTLP